ncbi:Chemotaxis protein CheW [compost metagenome]
MLFLLFQIGRDRYALEAAQVALVLPLAALKKVPGTPPWVMGLFNYAGQHVPVLDVSLLATGQAAAARLSTRLVLTHYTPPGQAPQLLGLVVEKATNTLRAEPAEFTPSGLSNEDAPYLGPVLRRDDGLIQRIDVQDLLDETVLPLLFPQGVDA